MMNEDFVGNLSTIIKILILTFVPAAFLNQVDANTLSVVIAGVIMFVFSMIDARYSNTFKIFEGSAEEETDISDEGV